MMSMTASVVTIKNCDSVLAMGNMTSSVMVVRHMTADVTSSKEHDSAVGVRNMTTGAVAVRNSDSQCCKNDS